MPKEQRRVEAIKKKSMNRGHTHIQMGEQGNMARKLVFVVVVWEGVLVC